MNFLKKHRTILVIIIIFLIGILLYLLRAKGVFAFIFSISKGIEFLGIIITVLSTVTAIITGFFFIILQSIESAKQSWFLSYQNELNNLNQYIYGLSDKQEELKLNLLDILNKLTVKTKNDFPFGQNEWNEIVSSYMDMKWDNEYHLNAGMILGKVEIYMNELGVITIQIGIISMIFDKIKHLFTIISFEIIVLLVLYFSDGNFSIDPIIILSLLIGFTYYTIFGIFDLLDGVKIHYRKLKEEVNVNYT